MRVMLDIFSGRPNPSWKLSPDDVIQLRERLADRFVAPPEATPPALGFRGFVVVSDSEDEPARFNLPSHFRVGSRIPGGLLNNWGVLAHALWQQESDSTALWLLETSKGAVDDDLLQFVNDSLRGPLGSPPSAAAEPEQRVILPSISPGCTIQTLIFGPAFWNNPPVRLTNNCYNFANNFRSDTIAQPGRATGNMYTAFECDNVSTAAASDGCTEICAGLSKLVALVIWPNVDFHWYRLQAGGFWAHKIGIGQATNLDSFGRVIGGALTPQNCGRGPYTTFCGYRFSPFGIEVF